MLLRTIDIPMAPIHVHIQYLGKNDKTFDKSHMRDRAHSKLTETTNYFKI